MNQINKFTYINFITKVKNDSNYLIKLKKLFFLSLKYFKFL